MFKNATLKTTNPCWDTWGKQNKWGTYHVQTLEDSILLRSPFSLNIFIDSMQYPIKFPGGF